MNSVKVKAVIFDGDGTLWRPKGLDENSRPDSIYMKRGVEKDAYSKLSLVDGVLDLLHSLQVRGYVLFIVSAHPTPGQDALNELKSKILNLGIADYIEKYYCSDGSDKNGKTHVLQSILNEYDIKPNDAYMVGDSYYYDYEAGNKAGVNSIFIRNNYCKQPSPLRKDVRSIGSVIELVVQ